MKGFMLMTWAALAATLAVAEPAPQPCLPYSQSSDAQAWICLTGTKGAGTQESKQVIRTAAEWKAFWSEHAAGQAPAVDFSQNSVVAFASDDAASFKAVKVATGSDAAALKEAGVEAPSTRMYAPKSRVTAILSGVRAAEAQTDSVVAGADRRLASLTGFDIGSGALRDVVARPAVLDARAPAATVRAVKCDPRIDDDCKAPAPPKQDCIPNVTCQKTPRPQPKCDPRIDDDCRTPSQPTVPQPPVSVPSGSYVPRPSNPPTRFPDWRSGNLDRYDREADVASLWMSQLDVYGDPIEDASGWSHSTARGTIDRAGSEKGTQGTRYHVTLVSQETRSVYRLYWRYVGYNCNPNDSSRCSEWRVQQAWFRRGTETGRASAMNVAVEFVNDQPLLPWETESIGVTYDGSSVGVDDSYGAFRYSVNGPIVNQQTGVATIELTPTSRRKRAPEFDKVNVAIENKAGSLMMKVEDQRAQFYQGENLELVYQVMRKCSGWWECTKNFGDVKVTENSESSPVSIAVQSGRTTQYEAPVPGANASGEYYLNWYFRRAGSKISDGSWSSWKATPKVKR